MSHGQGAVYLDLHDIVFDWLGLRTNILQFYLLEHSYASECTLCLKCAANPHNYVIIKPCSSLQSRRSSTQADFVVT